jgi:hypothetical protein
MKDPSRETGGAIVKGLLAGVAVAGVMVLCVGRPDLVREGLVRFRSAFDVSDASAQKEVEPAPEPEVMEVADAEPEERVEMEPMEVVETWPVLVSEAAEAETMEEEPPPVFVEEEPVQEMEAEVEQEVDFKALARTPSELPRIVTLLRDTPFAAILNGKVIGSVTAPPGTRVRLLRISAVQAVVEFRGARQTIPISTTDLERRVLLARRLATFSSPTPESRVRNSTPQPVSSVPVVPQEDSSSPEWTPAEFKRRVRIEVVRGKKVKIEGGDYDDRLERVSLRVKFRNGDPMLDFENLSAALYVFAESVTSRRTFKLMGAPKFEFSLPARGDFEYETDEYQEPYDLTNARFGYRYDGWILIVKDESGKIVCRKSTSPSMLKHSKKLADISVGSTYNRSLDAVSLPTF